MVCHPHKNEPRPTGGHISDSSQVVLGGETKAGHGLHEGRTHVSLVYHSVLMAWHRTWQKHLLTDWMGGGGLTQ